MSDIFQRSFSKRSCFFKLRGYILYRNNKILKFYLLADRYFPKSMCFFLLTSQVYLKIFFYESLREQCVDENVIYITLLTSIKVCLC